MSPSAGFMAPIRPSQTAISTVAMSGGKGFGGGEATRDPEPTYVNPNDPKGKQQAIHKAESFAEYLAKRTVGARTAPAATDPHTVPPASAPAAAAPPAHVAPPAAAPPAPAPATSKAPMLNAEERLAIAHQQAIVEAAEDAALPPIAAGSQVTFTCPSEPWLNGRTGFVRNYDDALNKYMAYIDSVPNGEYSPCDKSKPLLVPIRRSQIQ
eukprot:CAMPEP_0115846170 /NCGR_PEP_ID=MMETSP0287-20121206/9725_1 /TAXON_ID=412157 /ORGANISM="Chrysochromulina rotalis, Strain UIO044" /LENGTH=209 /DNA_ID=CAMNT_0003299957 /DNA_START=86 /DNA_END=715 /DNA_ORIENTATION=-